MAKVLIVENLEPGQNPWWLHHVPPRPELDIEIACIPEYSLLKALPKLLAAYRRSRRYDVIITNQDGYATFLFAALNTLLRRRTPRHFVVEFITKERNSTLYSGLKYALMRWMLRSVSRFICSARREVEVYSKELGLPRERFVHIPLMTNPKFLEWEGPPADESGYVFAGGRTGRDFATFLAAASQLNTPIEVITSPHIVAGIPVPPNVELLFDLPFATYIEHVKRAKIVVVPLSNWEISIGQSVILEAMALGRPLIATRAPGSVDYVEDGVTGLLVPPGDVEALRQAIESLLNDTARATELALRAREQVQQRFIPAAVRGKLFDLIGEFPQNPP